MRSRIQPLIARLQESGTDKAAGLAAAMIVSNVLGLIASVVFARLVGDYGALAALLSYVVILSVVGQAMQVATAREGVLGHLGVGEGLITTLERWARSLLIFSVGATIVSILVRQPIADLVGVPDQAWAAAAGIPGGCIYLWLCILRGALQSTSDFRSVGLSLIGENGTRVVAGAVLAAGGLGVGGAFLGSLVAWVLMCIYCTLRLYRDQVHGDYPRWRLPRDGTRAALSLLSHLRSATVPIIALGIVQLLQNVDLIAAKHRFDDHIASSYAVSAVAAKVLVWVAIGASFYLVPETSRLASKGSDARPVLLRTLAIIAVCAIPCLLIFAFAAHPLLAIVFGKRRAIASGTLLPLGAAFTMLAMTYLAVQYMLALRRVWFLIAIGLLAIAEPFVLAAAPHRVTSFALVVLAIQAAGAIIVFGIALRRRLAIVDPDGAGPPGGGRPPVGGGPPVGGSEQAELLGA